MKNFNNYFIDSIDYPNDIAVNPLPLNVMYNYVSSTFLNGFINYVEIRKAFVLSQYYRWNEQINHTISIQDPPKSCKWVDKTFRTKDELFNTLIIPGIQFHTKLDRDFNDAVVILARAGEIDNPPGMCYYYFYYDLDCSDCNISRFLVKEAEYIVTKKFIYYINSFEYKDKPREIPFHYFTGWVEG